MHLSRDDILKAEDNASEEVQVPEWGGAVLVRGMTGRERDEFELSLMEQGRGGRMTRNLTNTRAKLVSRCVVDDDGKRLFTAADIQALGDKNAAAIERIFDVAARLSGLTEAEQEEMSRDFTPEGGGGSPTP